MYDLVSRKVYKSKGIFSLSISHDPPASTVTPVQTNYSLQRLPVPHLNATLQKYLKSVKPLVNDEEYLQTETLVREFGSSGGIGEKLQRLLEERSKNKENWLSDWWLNVAYLDYRWPVVVYSSPGLVFPLQEFIRKDDQIRYAAKLIAGALDYKIQLDDKSLPQETMGGKPLDMSQYYRMLSTCRIPGITRDSLRFYGLEENPPNHIVVAHNNHFFKVNIRGKNGQYLSENQIYDQLQDVIRQSVHPAKPVGILTTQNRNVWGKVYQKLVKDKQNRKTLSEIQSSIFLMCIDAPNPDLGQINKRTLAALQLVHGGGSRGNSGNRWYDKTVQFVVGTDGENGLTYEHSPAEGPPLTNMLDHIMKFIQKGWRVADCPAVDIKPPVRLNFNITDDVAEEIDIAKRDLDILVSDLEMTCFTMKAYGKNFIKSQKLSPDSYIQMAIQLAYYRIHSEPGACYESASLRQFLYGRTETIRSTSNESVDFCKVMLFSQTDKEKVLAIRNAIDAHKRYAVDAVNGHGVDRHLLGLKMIAIENGMDVPKLFLDTGYIRSTHYKLSTSQVPAKCDAVMGYGPLVPDGYGCCYNPRDNEINFAISACNSSPETSTDRFREALEQSLTEMHDALVGTQAAKL